MMKPPLFATLTTGLALLLGTSSASAIELYNGLSSPSQTPNQQGWLYLNSLVAPVPTTIATNQGSMLDTSGNNANYAGYFRLSPMLLDRSKGYTITFRVQINAESHISPNRAGFSLIVMSNKLVGEQQPYGLELGFWENSIWAQNVGFTRGENVSYDTKTMAQTYQLSVKDGGYQLFVNGITKPILTGNLRQYTGFISPPNYPNPYLTSNLMFMGDNATSAKVKVTIVNLAVN
jgi:hypothetical protein